MVLGCENKNSMPVDLEVTVCGHPNCAEATIMQVTDQYYPSSWEWFLNDSRKFSATWAEFLAFKYNIPVHVFEQNVKGKEFEEFLNMGRGGVSVYYPSCFDEYRKSKLDSIIYEIEKVYGRKPTTLSFGCGIVQYHDSLPSYILGGRTTSYMTLASGMDVISWYGNDCGISVNWDFSDSKSILTMPIGGRYYRSIQKDNITIQDASFRVVEQVKKTIKNSGFYVDFMHWQDYYENDEGELVEGVTVMPEVFKAMANGIKDTYTAKVDYNEAVEYLYAKEAIQKVTITVLNKKEAILQFKLDAYRPVDYHVIQTPVTIRLYKKDLGQFKYDKAVLGSTLINVRDDGEYVLFNVMLDYSNPDYSVNLHTGMYRTLQPKIKDLKIVKHPFIDAVISSNAAKYILFRRKKEANNYEVEIIERTKFYSKKFNLVNLDSGYVYFCGAIDKNRESTLIELF
jgi:hypothetical protein